MQAGAGRGSRGLWVLWGLRVKMVLRSWSVGDTAPWQTWRTLIPQGKKERLTPWVHQITTWCISGAKMSKPGRMWGASVGRKVLRVSKGLLERRGLKGLRGQLVHKGLLALKGNQALEYQAEVLLDKC